MSVVLESFLCSVPEVSAFIQTRDTFVSTAVETLPGQLLHLPVCVCVVDFWCFCYFPKYLSGRRIPHGSLLFPQPFPTPASVFLLCFFCGCCLQLKSNFYRSSEAEGAGLIAAGRFHQLRSARMKQVPF